MPSAAWPARRFLFYTKKTVRAGQVRCGSCFIISAPAATELYTLSLHDALPIFMAVNIHITIIELNALHTKRQNLFQELDAVIHLLMEAKHWGLRKTRNATSLNSRFKSLDTLKVKIISVTFRRVIRTNHKKASKIWRHENIQLGGCQSCRLFPRQIRANTISFTVFPEIVPSIGNSFINTMKNINHTRSSISDDIRNILCSSANMRRAIPLILRLLMN